MRDVFGLLTGDTLEGWVLQRLRSNPQFRLQMDQERFNERINRETTLMAQQMWLAQAGAEKGMGPGGRGSIPTPRRGSGLTGSAGDE